MLRLLSMPGAMSGGAKAAYGNSGAGAFSDGTYLILGLLFVVLVAFGIKNFNRIMNFIFKK